MYSIYRIYRIYRKSIIATKKGERPIASLQLKSHKGCYFIMTLRALPSRMTIYKPLPLMALSLVPPTV